LRSRWVFPRDSPRSNRKVFRAWPIFRGLSEAWRDSQRRTTSREEGPFLPRQRRPGCKAQPLPPRYS
jgi:hypothetical protein